MLSRTTFLQAALAALAAPAAAGGDPFAALERRTGGRLGVAAIDLRTGRRFAHRAGERFPLASTWKLPLVMAVLARVDAGHASLGQPVRIAAAQLEPPYSPIAARFPHGGTLPLDTICALTISRSDNTGADVLARLVGGPAAVTAYLRSLGVRGVRADRFERQLPNSASPADPRDTGTPAAMAELVARLVRRSPLSPASTARLLGWMRATTTGDARLRAGAAPGWHVADKTGTYHNAANDVGLLYPPGGAAPIAVACYTLDPAGQDAGSAACAAVARLLTARNSVR